MKTLTARPLTGLRLPRWLTRGLGSESGFWAALMLLIPILVVVLTLTVAGGYVAKPGLPFVDYDYWWHLATGNWILNHHRVPTADPFSWTHGGKNWVADEWLSELILALTVRAGGVRRRDRFDCHDPGRGLLAAPL